MQHNVLTALSPIDGRYQNKTAPLAVFGSEYALIKYRVLVEIHWLIHLARDAKLPALSALTDDICDALGAVASQFTVEDAQSIKDIERETNHDVKAVEYFVKSKIEAMDEPDLKKSLEFVHFGCTSEDINNLAHGLMLKGALSEVILPALTLARDNIATLGRSCSDIAMMARTHGQPASPTTVGKELMNVVARLDRQLKQMNEQPILGKMNGAVGNFNAHTIAYPDLDWQGISRRFVESLGLDWNAMTTQIEPHDYMAELFQNLVRSNTILIDFDRDIWSYISIGYFKQRAVAGETGSSTMPHKVNPIDFENSEGNLGIANAMLSHLAEKLPISRWQRDLTDSTVIRNVGMALGYCLIAYQSTVRGLAKLDIDQTKIQADLTESWELLGEAVQTVMRRYGLENPYERLKAATRGRTFDRSAYLELIEDPSLPEAAKEALRALEPSHYTGLAERLAKDYPPSND